MEEISKDVEENIREMAREEIYGFIWHTIRWILLAIILGGLFFWLYRGTF